MRLLIVRHAIAVAAGMPGIPDAERPLTPAGARKFRAAAKGLAAILDPPDVLLASPLLREGYGIAAASRVRSRYSWERIGQETLAVYEALLAPRMEAAA